MDYPKFYDRNVDIDEDEEEEEEVKEPDHTKESPKEQTTGELQESFSEDQTAFVHQNIMTTSENQSLMIQKQVEKVIEDIPVMQETQTNILRALELVLKKKPQSQSPSTERRRNQPEKLTKNTQTESKKKTGAHTLNIAQLNPSQVQEGQSILTSQQQRTLTLPARQQTPLQGQQFMMGNASLGLISSQLSQNSPFFDNQHFSTSQIPPTGHLNSRSKPKSEEKASLVNKCCGTLIQFIIVICLISVFFASLCLGLIIAGCENRQAEAIRLPLYFRHAIIGQRCDLFLGDFRHLLVGMILYDLNLVAICVLHYFETINPLEYEVLLAYPLLLLIVAGLYLLFKTIENVEQLCDAVSYCALVVYSKLCSYHSVQPLSLQLASKKASPFIYITGACAFVLINSGAISYAQTLAYLDLCETRSHLSSKHIVQPQAAGLFYFNPLFWFCRWATVYLPSHISAFTRFPVLTNIDHLAVMTYEWNTLNHCLVVGSFLIYFYFSKI